MPGKVSYSAGYFFQPNSPFPPTECLHFIFLHLPEYLEKQIISIKIKELIKR